MFGFRCGNQAAYSNRIASDKLTHFNIADVGYVAPMPGPSGNLHFHNTKVYAENGELLHELNKSKPEHESIGMLGNGNDALFSVEFSAGPKGGCDGNIIAHDLPRDVISERKGYGHAKAGTYTIDISNTRMS